MADDPKKKDFRDRNRVSGEQTYEVRHFAEEAGISLDQARNLIKRFGSNRELLRREAQKLKESP
jgi:hypothetical protein